MLTVNFIQQQTNIFHKYPNQFQQRKQEISWKCHEVKLKIAVLFFMLIFGAYNNLANNKMMGDKIHLMIFMTRCTSYLKLT